MKYSGTSCSLAARSLVWTRTAPRPSARWNVICTDWGGSIVTSHSNRSAFWVGEHDADSAIPFAVLVEGGSDDVEGGGTGCEPVDPGGVWTTVPGGAQAAAIASQDPRIGILRDTLPAAA